MAGIPTVPERGRCPALSSKPNVSYPRNLQCGSATDSTSSLVLPVPFLLSLLLMSSVLAQYESFLVAHVSTISSLESTLRSITWILPGRFKDAELASEARQYYHTECI